MGSGESTTRKVSYGVDDEDRVRVLRGVKLSEDVLQRMRGVANISQSSLSSGLQKDKGSSPGASSASQSKQNPQHRAQPSSQSSKPASNAKEEQRRFERQQAILKDELAKIAQREKELANEKTKASIQERRHTRQESEKTKQLALQLQKKDLQLKALEAFYQEQLTQLEKKNLERYEESKEQFHQAVSKTEANIRSCSTTPVCSGLQAQILSCYRDNRDQTLKCSDLAKEYMQCINAAKKLRIHRKLERKVQLEEEGELEDRMLEVCGSKTRAVKAFEGIVADHAAKQRIAAPHAGLSSHLCVAEGH